MANPRARGAAIVSGILAISISFLFNPLSRAEPPAGLSGAGSCAVPAEAAPAVPLPAPPGRADASDASCGEVQVQTAGAEFPWTRPALEPARTGSGSRAAIYALIALCVGMLGALLAGAAGAAGIRDGRRFTGRVQQNDALLRERDQEAREQREHDDAARREFKPR